MFSKKACLVSVLAVIHLTACGKSSSEIDKEKAAQQEQWKVDAMKIAAQQAAAVDAGAAKILAERKAADAKQEAADQVAHQANLVAEAETQLRARSFDPKAVEFRNVVAGADYVCGELNGKNRFGGLVGFKAFVVTDKGAYMESSSDNLEQSLFELSAKQVGCKTTVQ